MSSWIRLEESSETGAGSIQPRAGAAWVVREVLVAGLLELRDWSKSAPVRCLDPGQAGAVHADSQVTAACPRVKRSHNYLAQAFIRPERTCVEETQASLSREISCRGSDVPGRGQWKAGHGDCGHKQAGVGSGAGQGRPRAEGG